MDARADVLVDVLRVCAAVAEGVFSARGIENGAENGAVDASASGLVKTCWDNALKDLLEGCASASLFNWP